MGYGNAVNVRIYVSLVIMIATFAVTVSAARVNNGG